MSSVVSQTSSDFFYMRLRTINPTDADIPCVVELDEVEELISDPSTYFVAVLNFSASLGSSDLYYAAPDGKTPIYNDDGSVNHMENRTILYTALTPSKAYQKTGKKKEIDTTLT